MEAFGLVGFLGCFHTLPDVGLTIFQQAIDTLGDFVSRSHDGLGAAATGLNTTVESAQSMVGMMTALSGHAKRPGRGMDAFAAAGPPLLLARGFVLGRAQSQPTGEVFGRGPFAHVMTDLTQDL